MSIRILVRADASTSIGAGHVMRCLALAQAWIDKGATVYWLASELPSRYQDRLAEEGVRIVLQPGMENEKQDVARTILLADSINADWVVLDGYAFGEHHQAMLQQAGRRVMFVDDNNNATEYPADIVLNQNVYAIREMYEGMRSEALFLLGPRYALLRREFRLATRPAKIITRNARNILVTLGGGGGNSQIAANIVNALQDPARTRGFQVRLLAGGTAAQGRIDISDTEDWLKISSFTEDMPSALAWADLAISAAGTTVYELMMMGVPSLLVVFAENQRPIANRLHEMGIGLNLGSGETLADEAISRAVEELIDNQELRLSMSERGKAAVDGEGALRVMKVMQAGLLRLRTAQPADIRLLWEWANDPDARGVSFSPATIPWEDHVEWFTKRLGDAKHRIYIAENRNGTPVGTVRFELDGEEAVISVSIANAMRREGYGRWLIRLGSQEILRNLAIRVVNAYIKPDNSASVRAFENAGFRYHAQAIVREQPALLYKFTSSSLLSGRAG